MKRQKASRSARLYITLRQEYTSVFRKILLDHDGSERGREILERSLPLLTRLQGDVAILAVIRPSEFALDVAAQTALETATEDLAHQLATMQRRLQFAGVETVALIRLGDPAEEITRAAQEWQADLIVTPRCRGFFAARFALGATASRVLARAHCPVLIVR